MSIYGKRKTALSLNGILGRPQGREVLHLMINLELSLQIAGSFQGDFCNPTFIEPAQIAQQNDGDIVVVVTVVDGAGTPVDLSAATDTTIILKKPDLTATIYSATFSTNGRDGKMQVALDPTALDQVGYYFVQSNLTIASISKSTTLGSFEVANNIEVAP